MTGESDEEVVGTRVEKGLKRKIRIEAARQGKSMSEAFREALYDWADDQGIETPRDGPDESPSDAPADD